MRTFNYNTNNFLTYNKMIADRLSIDATVGMSFQKSTTDITDVQGQQFPSDDLQKITSAGKVTGGTSTLSAYTFLSYFARVNLKFADKYLLSASGRFDGSSRFGSDNRYGFFPALSAGWILSEESFLKSQNVVSFLKPRVSAGTVGNAEIGNYPSQGLWSSDKYNSNATLYPSQLANPKLGWETTTQYDVGIDFGFLNNRITGEIDYYAKYTHGLLYNRASSWQHGVQQHYRQRW
ncbi:MAG: TonB-dependent receptor [Bacteroidota bacterium]